MDCTDQFQPLQLKGEIMDLEFTMDTDHRKRRRNRTTQSCLNCHTSKRKCDRKRPCQRCIQLGLTGLCVYEIDDPALRDDPTIDETTRLRNRIAELESLVRELRGKPHPRWADSSFRDGDPSEKWHSRATKCIPATNANNKRRPPSPELVQDQSLSPSSQANNNTNNHNHQQHHPHGTRGLQSSSTMLTPIKTESTSEPSQLFRFSPSPAPSMRYHTFQTDVVRSPPPTSPYDPNPSSASAAAARYRGGGGAAAGGTTANGSYHHPHHPSSPYPSPTTHLNSSGPSSFSDAGSTYHNAGGGAVNSFCSCHTSPALGPTYMSLAQQLDSTAHTLRQYHPHTQQHQHHHHHPHHPHSHHHSSSSHCQLYRSILELNSLMQGIDLSESVSRGPPSYDSTTPTESEILTPLSAASSGPTTFHTASPIGVGGGGGGGGGVSPQEWALNVGVSGAGYGSYFPVQSGEHASMYAHIVS
ncbi:hypothetical protein GYMLUDRAFT_181224 [Collybiopsis luxurians FD-317 M1]|uniref:Zn(2)-C6 fungal-type domain-containing protein n=1 Tax=Collybiopsis luxurians FD-317 M1 TaxID=944289 RepID=A0A0D0BB81_9AGAR|nr:hypothetical protein GYMLUDRAFT_181224 [Collybiopsis luxurians FD-317 M1]